MKLSKFIKDVLLTGFTQVLVLILGLLLLKLAAGVLGEKNFGLFMLVRRWMAVLAPVLTLNLALGITKFVSSDREGEDRYLKISLFIVTGILAVFIGISFLMGESISSLFFNHSRYALLVKVLFIYLYAYTLYLLIYSYYRGRQQILAANVLNLSWFFVPVLLFFALGLAGISNKYTVLVYFYGLFAAAALGAAFVYFKKKHLFNFYQMYKSRFEQEKSFLLYGMGRIPSSFFLTLIFGIPVFTATYNISLEAAGYMGVSVAVLRMMEIAAYPFNMIFLPKFSELSGKTDKKEIKEKSAVVLNFIITFLPAAFILLYGLSKHIVIFWLGNNYIASAAGLKILILFSAFYIAYSMIRGILNGILLFPYVNFICLAGFAVSALLTFTFMNKTITHLALAFGISLSILGITSSWILIKKLNLYSSLTALLKSGIYTLLVFVVLVPGDNFIFDLKLNIYAEFSFLIITRVFLFFIVFLLFWKKTLWYNELRKRIGKHA